MLEIGGPTRLTYADMLLGYAKERGLKRVLIRTPVYAPRLSAYWVHMVTPIHWRIVLPLIEGLRARLIVRDEAAKKLFPQIKPIDFQTASRARARSHPERQCETSWSDALVTVAGDVKPYQFTVEEGMYVETRQMLLDLSPEDVFRSYTGIGGSAAGSTWTGRGPCVVGWTKPSVAWGCGVVVGIPTKVRAGKSLDFARRRSAKRSSPTPTR